LNILQLVNALTWGGAQILVADLARAARSAGHAVVIAAFRDGPVGSQLRQEGFDVRILGEEAFDLVAAWRLLRLWREFRPDVIHSHLSRATFWARFLRHRAPQTALVTTIHGFESGSFHIVEKRMASLSDHLVFPSAFLEHWYGTQIRNLPAGRSSVLYPGVEITAPDAQRPNAPECEPRIGTLSRLHRVKGVDILLEACARLSAEQRFRIVIGGEGKEHDRLSALAGRLGLSDRLEWAGPIASPKAFLDKIDIFAAPSREEAFGITICEAMERGLPVVASRVGGIPEILRDGTDGFLVTPERPEELAAALHRLLGNAGLRQAMGAAGNARVRTEFRRDACISKHFDIYRSMLSPARPAARRLHLAISSNELGGGERMALAVAGAMKRRGVEVTATCAGQPLAGRLKTLGIPTSTVPMRAGGLFFGIRLARDLFAHRPDLVNAHLNRAALISGFFRLLGGPPVVSHVHGLNRAIYYRWSDLLVAVSASVGEHLRRQEIPVGRIAVIPNRIPGSPVVVQPPPAPPWIIGIPAKLHANKGHAWALEAIERHMALLPDLRIEIFGDGPERDALQRLAETGSLSGRVRLHGFQPDMDLWYPQLHAVLLPSLGEGIPLSLIEPMRWGIPCIATDVGGIPEIVEDEVTGVLVKPGDGDALIAGINRVLSIPAYEGFRSAARDRFRRINDFDGMIDRFASLCETLQALPS